MVAAAVSLTTVDSVYAERALPRGVKAGALEDNLGEKMLYKFLGEGLVSVVAETGLITHFPAASKRLTSGAESSLCFREGIVVASLAWGWKLKAVAIKASSLPATTVSLLLPEDAISAYEEGFFLGEELLELVALPTTATRPQFDSAGLMEMSSFTLASGATALTQVGVSTPLASPADSTAGRGPAYTPTGLGSFETSLVGGAGSWSMAEGGWNAGSLAVGGAPLKRSALEPVLLSLSSTPFVRFFKRELERVRAEDALVADKRELGALREGRAW